MTELIMAAMRRARPGICCAAADGPRSALVAAMSMAVGSPVLLVYEKLAAAREALAAIGARPLATDGGLAAGGPASQQPQAAPGSPSEHAPSGPLRRADRPSQWNRGHW
jgi:hypothetical protein